MSGPIRFIILAIVIGIKKSRYVCFVKKVCSVQSIHTELAKLYSQKLIAGRCASQVFGDASSICRACLIRRNGIKRDEIGIIKWRIRCMNYKRVSVLTIALTVCAGPRWRLQPR